MSLVTKSICFIGPNPTPATEKTSYAPNGPLKVYMEAFIFGNVNLAPPKAFELAVVKKKSIAWEDLTGFDVIFIWLADELTGLKNGGYDKFNKYHQIVSTLKF